MNRLKSQLVLEIVYFFFDYSTVMIQLKVKIDRFSFVAKVWIAKEIDEHIYECVLENVD